MCYAYVRAGGGGGSPVELYQQREVAFCVSDTLSHQEFRKYPTNNWNVRKQMYCWREIELEEGVSNPPCRVLRGDVEGGWLSLEVWVPDQSTVNKRKDLNHLLIRFRQKQSAPCVECKRAASSAGGSYHDEFTCYCVKQTD